MVIKAKIEPLLPVIQEICNGLCCYNLSEVVKRNTDIMRPVFCRDDSFIWQHDDFVNSLRPAFSESGGNKKSAEIVTYKALLDVIEYCFNDGKILLFVLSKHLQAAILYLPSGLILQM